MPSTSSTSSTLRSSLRATGKLLHGKMRALKNQNDLSSNNNNGGLQEVWFFVIALSVGLLLAIAVIWICYYLAERRIQSEELEKQVQLAQQEETDRLERLERQERSLERSLERQVADYSFDSGRPVSSIRIGAGPADCDESYGTVGNRTNRTNQTNRSTQSAGGMVSHRSSNSRSSRSSSKGSVNAMSAVANSVRSYMRDMTKAAADLGGVGGREKGKKDVDIATNADTPRTTDTNLDQTEDMEDEIGSSSSSEESETGFSSHNSSTSEEEDDNDDDYDVDIEDQSAALSVYTSMTPRPN